MSLIEVVTTAHSSIEKSGNTIHWIAYQSPQKLKWGISQAHTLSQDNFLAPRSTIINENTILPIGFCPVSLDVRVGARNQGRHNECCAGYFSEEAVEETAQASSNVRNVDAVLAIIHSCINKNDVWFERRREMRDVMDLIYCIARDSLNALQSLIRLFFF